MQDTEDKAVPWAEWQADYMAGALLMPKTPFCNAFQSYAGYGGGMEPMSEQRIAELAANLARDFHVSRQAAYIRMYKLNLVTLSNMPPPAAQTMEECCFAASPLLRTFLPV